MKLSESERTELCRLLAKATGGGPDFSSDEAEIIITIGQGIFWSKELHQGAIELAKKVDKEFAIWGSIPE